MKFPLPRTRHQTGLTLIEVLISIVLGSIVLTSISTMYLGSRRSMELNEGLAGMQETGRFTLEYLLKNTRYAGWNPRKASLDQTSSTPMQIIFSDLTSANLRKIDAVLFIASTPAPPISEGGNSTIPDPLSLIVRLRDEPNCIGNDASGTFIQVFAVDTTNQQLKCSVYNYDESIGPIASTGAVTAVSNSTNKVISDAVSNLQIRYGIDTDDTGSINYYVSASSLAVVPSANFAAVSSVASIQVEVGVTDIENNIDTLPDKTFSSVIRFIRN